MTTWEIRQQTLRRLSELQVAIRAAQNAIQTGEPFLHDVFLALERADEALSTYDSLVHSE